MPLTTINMVPGGHLMSVDIKQYADLLTGVMADQPVTINNRLNLSGPIQQVEVATPASPPAGNMRLYPKTDGNYYKLDPAGVEMPLGASSDEVWINTEAPVPRAEYEVWIDTDAPDPAPGPPPTTWIFTQGPPSGVWTINHSLNCYPSVTAVDTGNSVVIPDVQYNNANTLTCSFGSPTLWKGVPELMPTLGAPLDFSKYEARQIRAHQLGAAPSSPVTGQLYYNTADNTLWWWDGTAWQSAKGGAVAVPPATTGALGTIQLAGDLAGTATSPQIAAGVVTDVDVNAANKDGAVGTASMRTLGAGAQQAMPGNRTLDAVPAPVASVNLNNQRIISLLDPTGPQDAATKAYVDASAAGLDVKLSARAASTANVTIASPGAAIDGVTLAANDRVLLKNQTTTAENGPYQWNGAAAAMTRTTDANVSAEVTAGMFLFVEEGTLNADTGWVLTTNNPITLGTTGLTFAQFSGAGTITAGNGLTQTGSSIDVVGTTNRIVANADNIDIAATYVGQASITTLGTITTGLWAATPVPITNGGTGQSTAKTAREAGLTATGIFSNATHGAGTSISVTAATHGLRASRGLLVQVQDEATGAVEIPDIVVAANGDVTVTYGVSLTANTKRVTIIG